MLKQNNISIHRLKILLLGFFFYLGASAHAIAQEGREILESETGLGIYDDFEKRQHTDLGVVENKKPEGNASVHEENKPASINKPGDTEVKKEGMSTLSFNLLLYVVDKFREDK